MKLGITNTGLKWIAIITMIIDHVGAVLFPYYLHPEMLFLRLIGRIAFPIFAFLIVEGYHHTRDVNKYGMRLLAFAVLSEVPFDLAFFGTVFTMQHQNVFFTLALGLFALTVYDSVLKKDTFLRRIIATSAVFAIGMIAYFFKTDYGIFGIMLIVLIHVYNEKKMVALWIALINILMVVYYGGFFQIFALLSIPFILLYNGKKGPSLKYLFYAIYPVHIFLLYLLNRFVF